MTRIIGLLFISLILIACSGDTRMTDAEKLANFFRKKAVKIVVTDSGLGGLSVFADLAERISDAGIFERVDATYFNAQLDSTTGYNDLKTSSQKVRVFENALLAMQENFSPDMILIACNTLSVLYPQTAFSQKTSLPVIGIVGTGVELIRDRLQHNDSSKVIIFATLTTVAQNSHKQLLVAGGVAEDRIITQACPELAGSIERGVTSEKTRNLVTKYVDQALEKLPGGNEPVVVSLNCTHYGYVSNLFADCLRERNQSFTDMLDPNPYMVDFLFTPAYGNRYPGTEVNLKVVSQPELSHERITSIGSLIAETSPSAHEALKNYTFTPDLFEWKSIAGDDR